MNGQGEKIYIDDLVKLVFLDIYTCTLIRHDKNTSGGGVAIYIKNNLIFVQRDDFCSDTKLEILVAEIKIEKQNHFL